MWKIENLVPVMVWPIALVVIGVIFGFVFEKIILKKLKDLAERKNWSIGEVMLKAIYGHATLWFSIGGIYLAVLNSSLGPTALELLQKMFLVIIVFDCSIYFFKPF